MWAPQWDPTFWKQPKAVPTWDSGSGLFLTSLLMIEVCNHIDNLVFKVVHSHLNGPNWVAIKALEAGLFD